MVLSAEQERRIANVFQMLLKIKMILIHFSILQATSMKSFMFLVLTALFIASAIALELGLPRKIVCFWNSTILDRQSMSILLYFIIL